jgi:hypothetical protein
MAKKKSTEPRRRDLPEQGASRQDKIQTLLARAYPVADLFDMDGDEVIIAADAAEKAAIAAAFGLERIGRLRATMRIKPEGKQLHVTGEVRATIGQICVVSLEPFESELVEAIDIDFSSDPAALAASATDIPGNESEWIDPPDPITSDTIDLGELALEFFALGIDPYPRKPGVEFKMEDVPEDGDSKPASPFEALRALKDQT